MFTVDHTGDVGVYIYIYIYTDTVEDIKALWGPVGGVWR